MSRGSVVAAGLLLAAVLAIALDTAVAAVAHDADVSHRFQPLHVGSYASLTILGMACGAVGWTLIRAYASSPRRILRVLVPSVLVLSLVPDVAVGLGNRPGHSWGAVAALMTMHVIVTAVSVLAFQRLLPLPKAPAAAPERSARPSPV